MTSLVGKYVLYSSKEHYSTGHVVADLSGAVLIQFDSLKSIPVVLPQRVVTIERLSEEESFDDFSAWEFFDTRELLDAYVEWLNGGGRPTTVVRLVREEEAP
jgi:hypothetical protein